jgi:hypothetical protein
MIAGSDCATRFSCQKVSVVRRDAVIRVCAKDQITLLAENRVDGHGFMI